MSVHYKFKSNLNYDTVTFDGLHISVSDLKKSIMQQKKIGKINDFDLQITNAQTKEVYDNDDCLIPKNTSVIISRVPVASGSKKNWEKPELPLPSTNDDSKIRFDRLVKNADIANSDVTEDDKVKAMISQSSQEYDPSQYVKSRSMVGPLPPNYTCYRCGKQGHWIKNCPTNNPDVKRSTGIPRSFMVTVDGPEHKGALLTSSGEYAVPRIDQQAYKEVKKEKPPFIAEDNGVVNTDAEIPDELLCMFCKSLLQDAVLIPCCGNSFCDECVRQALLDSDNHQCPICDETNVSPDTVIPNRFLRTAVLNFKNETGYTRVKKMFQPIPPPEAPQAHIESPQPSPDSTVETQAPLSTEVVDDLPKDNDDSIDPESIDNIKINNPPETVEEKSQEEPELSLDIQPGTPLADEPEDSMHPNVQREHNEDYHSSPYSHDPPEHYDQDSEDTPSSQDSAPNTIQTITNMRRDMNKFGRGMMMPGPRPHFSQGPRHYDRQGDNRDNYEYRNRYDHRGTERPPMRHGGRPPRFEHSQRDRRFHHSEQEGYRDYNHNRDREYEYNRRRGSSNRRYESPLPASAVPPEAAYPVSVPPQYSDLPSSHHPEQDFFPPPNEANFAPQPPPPGASPIDASPQPPPPGVGPLLQTTAEPVPPSLTSAFPPLPSEENQQKVEESIDDRIEAFQRQLEKRSARNRSSSRSSGSPTHKRSTSTSRSTRSRTYVSSHSWTRSQTRSRSRSRSRSRGPSQSSYSTRRSRTRSFSRSRSRSRYKSRSYSRSRSRTYSRSRSRDRRRTDSRGRPPPAYSRSHSASHSPSPRHYHHHRRYRHSPYAVRGNYNAPPPFGSSTYPASFSAASSNLNTFTAPYLVSQMHSGHQIQAISVGHPMEHGPPDRRYPYPEHYAPPPSIPFDPYQQVSKPYHHQRYERDNRTRLEPHEYQRRSEQAHHRIPGLVGDRSRQDYKLRYRNPRDQSRTKEIRELPIEPVTNNPPPRKSDVRTREDVRKKEEKEPGKHKRHHHTKKDSQREARAEAKASHDVKTEKSVESSNIISVEVQAEKDSDHVEEVQKAKTEGKSKEKKHKHKKRKSTDSSGKKKKVTKKAKQVLAADGHAPVKLKRKKKVKVADAGKKKATSKHSRAAVAAAVTVQEEPEDKDIVTSESNNLEERSQLASNIKTIATNDDSNPEPVKKESAIEVEENVPSEPEEGTPTSADAAFKHEEEEAQHDEEQESMEVEEQPQPDEEDTEETHPQEEELEIGVSESELDENILHVEVPELSKWEREEFEEESPIKPQRNSVAVPKEEKGALSSDIIQRAEKVFLEKRLKTPITVSPKDERVSQKSEKVQSESPPPSKVKEAKSPSKVKEPRSPLKVKEARSPLKAKEPRSSSKSATEKPCSPILEVTISTDKEKRSVKAKVKKDRSESLSKRVKLDRSKFTHPTDLLKPQQVLSRTVVLEPLVVKSHKIQPEEKRKSSVTRIKHSSSDHHRSRDRSPPRQVKSESRVPVDVGRSKLDHRSKESRFGTEKRTIEVSRHRSDRSRREEPSRRVANDPVPRDSRRNQEPRKRSRSSSRASSDSRNSSRRKQPCRRHEQPVKAVVVRHSDRDSREKRKSPRAVPEAPKEEKKESTSRQISHDSLEFEPNYDEFSEPEESETDVPAVPTTTTTSSSNDHVRSKSSDTRKHVKQLEHVIKTIASHVQRKVDRKKSAETESSADDSTSESESSDSDSKTTSKRKVAEVVHKHRHKKNKKHKKHKHKQKKKKSHKKSKQ